MEIKYVDAHCHLQFDDYSHDANILIARMYEEGVAGIVVGVDYESSEKAIELAEKHEHLFASVGVHPNRVGNKESLSVDDRRIIGLLAKHPKVVAIGECGLDYFRPIGLNDEIKNAQRGALRAHIKLATELNKPLIIHARPSKGTMDAYADLIEILKEEKTTHGSAVRGDIHFFVGGTQEAEQLIALGFTVSFTAVITFTHDYDAVIKSLPLGSVLSETDAPYVAPVTRRGERNDPLAVIDIVNQIAVIRSEDPETVRQALLENTKRLFALPLLS